MNALRSLTVRGIALCTLLALSAPLLAHQLAITTGYANSGTPEVGAGVSQGYIPLRAGGGFAAGLRLDIDKASTPLRFGPTFLFWNNLTGSTDPNARANYTQVELGGRLSLRTRTIPDLYAGGGAGYSFASYERQYAARNDGYEGDFSTGHVHLGAQVPTQNKALDVAAELSYHFGLDKPRRPLSVGPARAFLVQIGLAFHVQGPGQH